MKKERIIFLEELHNEVRVFGSSREILECIEEIKLCHDALRKCIDRFQAMNNKDNQNIIEYCEERFK